MKQEINVQEDNYFNEVPVETIIRSPKMNRKTNRYIYDAYEYFADIGYSMMLCLFRNSPFFETVL